MQNGTFRSLALICPISVSDSNCHPQNILYIPAVEIFAFLEREHKLPFFKGLTLSPKNLCALYKKLST